MKKGKCSGNRNHLELNRGIHKCARCKSKILYKCPKCGEWFDNNKYYRHRPCNDIKCEKCNRLFSWYSYRNTKHLCIRPKKIFYYPLFRPDELVDLFDKEDNDNKWKTFLLYSFISLMVALINVTSVVMKPPSPISLPSK